MSEPLTQLERQVYHFLIDFLAENTYQPSIREIARQFRIKSTKTVSDLLHALEGKGYIQRDESRSRGVRLIGFAAAGATQPTAYYRSVDGSPPLRDENRIGFITMDRRFLPTPDVFWLKVSDSSMLARGILDGDYVMVSPSTEAKVGDTVAVRTGMTTTVRTLSRRGEAAITLRSGDAGEAAIELGPDDDFALLGAVCGVFRPYFEQEPTPLMPVNESVLS
jgi:repressor LexA